MSIPWMLVAWNELGVRETPGSPATPRILEYGHFTTLQAASDEIPWCSSFVNWALARVGLSGTGSAAARSWAAWGKSVSPQYGAVIVLSRGSNPSLGHVGFYVDGGPVRLWLLGGNQGDSVSVARFPVARIVACRWPMMGPGERTGIVT